MEKLSAIKRTEFWCERWSISPQEAVALLGTANTTNRDLNRTLVRQLASDLVKGQWKFNGEALKFDSNGRLVDGQHRLTACRESQIALETVVCGGFAPEVFDTIDTGKKRNLQDILKIAGFKNWTTAGGALKWLDRLESKNPISTRTSSRTTSEFLAWAEELGQEFKDSVNFGSRTTNSGFRQAPGSMMAALHFRLSQINEHHAEEFLKAWIDSAKRADLETDAPPSRLAAAIADRMSRLVTTGGRFHDADRLMMITTAWNAWATGNKLTRSQLKKISVQDKRTPTKWPGFADLTGDHFSE